MLTNLIENRGKEFSNILKIGDYLARSLRENVELFYVDNNKVTYLTESGNVIVGELVSKPSLGLKNIEVDDSSILENEEAFDKITNKKISALLSNLIESDYNSADSTFDDLLSLFETKLSFNRIKERLEEKVQRFGEQTKIISSPEFAKFTQTKDSLVAFLKENSNILRIPEIKNGLKLVTVISKSFNIPKLTIESLKKDKKFLVTTQDKNTIYEHLCRQELIAKELLEAKKSFDVIWADNDMIHDLSAKIYESDNSKIEEAVAELIVKIPYFALASKKQLTNLVANSLSVNDITANNKAINTFVSNIYEMKKPAKKFVLDLLNEKYGINVSNLTDIPTFTNLIMTEMVVVSALSRLAPKNSVLKDVLRNLSESLKLKNGTESIDVADYLYSVFKEAGYSSAINETSLLSYLDFSQISDDLGKIGSILKMLRPVLQAGGAGGMGGDPQAAGNTMPGGVAQNPSAGLAGALDAIGGQMGGGKPKMKTPPMTDALPDLPGDESNAEGDPLNGGAGDAEDAANHVKGGLGDDGANPLPPDDMGGDEVPDMDAMEGQQEPDGDEGNADFEGVEGEEPEEPVKQVGGDDITNVIASIEDLLASIKGEIGDQGEEDPDGAVGMEDDFEFEGGDAEEAPELGGEESEEGGVPEEEGSFEESPEEDEEIPEPPKKDKKFPKK